MRKIKQHKLHKTNDGSESEKEKETGTTHHKDRKKKKISNLHHSNKIRMLQQRRGISLLIKQILPLF